MKRLAVRAFWLGVLPVALAGATLRFLVPAGVDPRTPQPLRFLAWLGEEHTAPFAVALFLVFSALARYWRDHLPGGHHLDSPAPPPGATTRRSLARSALFVGAVVAAALGGVFVRGSLIESYRVLSVSMLPTIEPGDRILVDKRAHLPQRGDVIVFKRPAGQPGPDVLLKRVIGLPGDTVEVNMGRPVINGWKVPHCDAGLFVYLGGVETVRGRLAVEFLDDRAYLTVLEPDAGPFAPHKLGPGDLFVLGDARGRSIDSRNLNEGRGGDIPSSAVLGRSSRILFEARHDGRIDWGRVWTEIGREAHLHGVDVTELRTGVEKCLRNPPASRVPRATLTAL